MLHWHRPDRTKVCIMCSLVKNLAEFSAYSYVTRQGKRSTRYESRCRECVKIKSKKRHQAIRPAAIERMKRRRLNKAIEVKNYDAFYRRSEHGKRVRAKCQRVRSARSRVTAGSSDPRITELYQQAADWERKLEACVATDDPLDLKIHVDHIIPVAAGGEHVFENLQLLGARDNMRKGAKPHSAWAREVCDGNHAL